MRLVPDVWAQMAARRKRLQNLLGLVHIALGLLTIVSAPVVVAGVAFLLLDVGVSRSELPVVLLLARGGAIVSAGVSLVVAGHAASRTVQERVLGFRLTRYDVILYLGWFTWAGAIWVATGNSFDSLG